MIALYLVFAAVVGHFALHLALYNRINATGLRRTTVKFICKLLLVSCITVPIVVAPTVYRSFDWHNPSLENFAFLSTMLLTYGTVCVLSVFFFGIPWILWRPIFRLEWIDARRNIRIVDVASVVDEPLAISTRCRWEARIPGNQIFELAIEEIELPVEGLPSALSGLRIAHLSDIHFTGDVSPAFTQHVVEEANRWRPDLYVITGDILDKQFCMDWLEPVFAPAIAELGKFFILGNHDLRVPDSMQTRRTLQRAGWIDVGGKTAPLQIGTERIEIIGNEAPWYSPPNIEPVSEGSSTPFRLLMSHTPDQITWARQRGVKLMLAGHTHGGQGRLPLLGPLISPSLHGSRYASGDFYKAPTTMHVSRGLAGVHRLRLLCRPELSLLTLRPA